MTQRSSHAALSCAVPTRGASTRSGLVEAIIVPASRGAASLDGAVNLARTLGAALIVLCSQKTVGEEVIARFDRKPASRLVVIDVPVGYRHGLMPSRTVAARFLAVTADRTSDLSLKRNLGLLLARLHGWGKVLFLDDDIGQVVDGRPTGLPDDTVHRLSAALDAHQIAGLACRDFPDNSVVCHARRLAGLPQDIFVSGAALGVNCNDHPLPFFPDLYNEDWFFFSRRGAARDVAHIGDAIQEPYDPFGDPIRARQEEFGDLLAEGLFALFESQPTEMGYRDRLDAADGRYWERFIAARLGAISVIEWELEIALEKERGNPGRLMAAIRSLDAATDQLARLSPGLCVDYLDAWAADLGGWERATQRLPTVGSTAEAMDVLGLRWWCDIRDRMTTAGVAWS